MVPKGVTSIGDSNAEKRGLRDLTTQTRYVILQDGVLTIQAYSFNGTSITSVFLPESVTEIVWGSFNDCKKLTSISLPCGMQSGVFSGCSSLVSVKLAENESYIGSGTFSGCTSLSEIILPNTLKTISVAAFYGCTALKVGQYPKQRNEHWE